MKAFALLIALLATVPAAAQTNCGQLPKTWEGTAYAVSGDTLAGIDLKPQLKLWGIRAPALGNEASPPAMRARAALEDMLTSAEHKVSCRLVAFDRECRAIAQCNVTAEWPAGSKAQPHDLAVRLVEDGFAYGAGLEAPPSWDKDASARIAHFEAISRQARKGLWSDWLGEAPPKP
jgi:endonuclease YncB( thermonuclease family)